MLEAVVWERIRPLARGRPWMKVAEEFVADLDSAWPSRLCSMEHAEAIGVQLEVGALDRRFRKLAKKNDNMARIRARAIRLLAESGQLGTPPDEMNLWEFFKPEANVLVNKGCRLDWQGSRWARRRYSTGNQGVHGRKLRTGFSCLLPCHILTTSKYTLKPCKGRLLGRVDHRVLGRRRLEEHDALLVGLQRL